MEIHPLSDLFPAMLEEEFQALKVDIQKQGLLDNIVTLEGKILDGRHRYRACEELGIKPRYSLFSGNDPIAFVRSKNLHRRNLTASQRAAVAAEIIGEYEKLATKRKLATLKQNTDSQ